MKRRMGRVIEWSPPMVMTRGKVSPFFARPGSSASVAGLRMRMLLWPSSIWWMAQFGSYLLSVRLKTLEFDFGVLTM